MPLYTFFPCDAEGVSKTFVAWELADDGACRDFADRVLDQHTSAMQVAVWLGERKVHSHVRGGSRRPLNG